MELRCWESTLESPLDSKKFKLVNSKENQPWIFTGKNDAEAEASILWPPNAKSQLIGKYPDAGKDWGQKEKRAAEDEITGRHHWINGHESEQTLGNSEWQGSMVCCSPRGHKEPLTRLSNWTATVLPWSSSKGPASNKGANWDANVLSRVLE